MSSGDYTRVTFNHLEDHIGVLMQQGRVLLDADFNELVEILERRIRAGTLDTIGPCAYPIKETPDAFLIQIAGTTVTIGRGRIYVHGLLAENHGKGTRDFDPHLGEEYGPQPLDYDEQPYLPKRGAVRAADEFPMPAAGGPHLLYIDVWQREITYLEEPDLIEKAAGVDSATRLQTAWQVKALANAGGTCATPDDQIPGWVDIIRPSGGRLTTAAVGVPDSTDPCIVNPTGGFRGTENRLYRVEVHEPGPLGTATFKWSRDNGSIASAVTAINAGLDEVTVSRTARDPVLRFSPQDWVEVLDDWHELLRKPGVLRKVVSVDDVSQTLVLDAPLPAGEFDTANLAARHTRVRRWDQKGLVLDAANNVVADVDALGGDIPTTGGVNFVIEDGVQAVFSVAPAGGIFRTGDYWVFAARTVDASVEILTAAPPRPVHHFCRLAMVTFPDDVEDCRTPWPPDFGEGCCTVVVAPGEDIQAALDSLPAAGGCVCLKAGVHPIRATLRIEKSDVCLHGESPGAIVTRTDGATLLRIGGAEIKRVERVRVEKLALVLAGERDVDPEGGAVVLVERANDVRLDDCRILVAPPQRFVGVGVRSSDGVHLSRVHVAGAGFGVFAIDQSRDVSVRDSLFEHPDQQGEDRGLVGILLQETAGPCPLEGNRITGFMIGIGLNDVLDPDKPPSSAATGSRIVGNTILRGHAREAPTLLNGIDVAADDCLVADNILAHDASGYGGIRLSGRRTRAVGNTLLARGREAGATPGIGILVGGGPQNDLAFGDFCLVTENRLLGRQVGVWVQGAEGVYVDGNLFLGVFRQSVGVALIGAERCRVGDNHMASFGLGVILADGRSNTISGNDLRLGVFAVHAVRETDWRALDNTIEAMDSFGLLGQQLHGGTRLSRNRLLSCVRAPGNAAAIAMAVLSMDLSTANEVAIESCEVVDTGLVPGGDPIPQATWGIFVWAFGCTLSGNLVTYSDTSRLNPQLESRAVQLLGLISFVVGDRRVAFGQAGLLGNKLLGVGRSALLEVPSIRITDRLSFQFERITFSNNDCFHLSTEPNDNFATVSLQALQMIAMGNHVRAGTRFFSFHFHGNRRTLFLGNITDGDVLGYPVPRPTPVIGFNFIG